MTFMNLRSIDATTAQAAIEATCAKARELKLEMSIGICDAAGHMKAFVRMDGASLISLQIANDKAYTSAATGLATHQWHEYIKGDAPLLDGIVHTARFIIFGGGFPITHEGAVIGAIGVSGGHYTQDMECARAGLAAIGAGV